MSVKEHGGSGGEAGMHGAGIGGVDGDEHEALPAGAVAPGFRFEPAQKAFLDLEDFFHLPGGDQGLGGGDGGVGEDDVLEFVFAGRQDGGALVDFGGIEQVEHREVLHGQDFVHSFQAQAAFVVEEVRDMSLLEAGLAGESQAGQFSGRNAIAQDLAQILLQDPELHAREYSIGGWPGGQGRVFHRQGGGLVNPTLTEKIHRDTIAEK